MDREKIVRWIDHFILLCFCVLVIFLPIAHTESIRAFSFGIPVGLWLIKMIINRQWLFQKTPFDLPLLLFTIIASLSLTTAIDFRYSLEELIGDWVTGVLLFYLVVNNLREEQIKYLLVALLLGNVIMVSYGIYEFFHRDGLLFDYQVRSSSLHSGFGTFSTYLVTVLPYFLLSFLFVRNNLKQSALLILTLLNFFALYLTHSRGAWVAAGVLLMLVGWRVLSKKTIFVFIFLVCLLLFFLVPAKILEHHTRITMNGKTPANIETLQARWELIKFSLGKLNENPFQMLGFGRRSFGKKFKEFDLKYKGAQLWHAHNSFLNITFQTGVQGLALFCFLLYELIRYFYLYAKRETFPLHKFFLLSTFMMVITFFVRNLSDDFFVDDSALLFWLLSGVAVSFRKG